MVRNILLASTCSAALILGAATAGAVASLDELKGAATVSHGAFQLAETDQGDAAATGEAEGATGDVTEEGSAVGATEQGTGEVTGEESAIDATEQGTGDVADEESAVGAADEEGTGGAHCAQPRVATGQPAESAADATC